MISQSSSIEIKTVSQGIAQNIPLRISDTLLRIGYEAIANAIRHSRCSQLTLSLVYGRATVEMIIEDDGAGFVISSDSAGFGIRGMHKRADNVSARFRIDSALGRGTALHVLAPLPPSFFRELSHRWLFQMRKIKNEHGRV
jgi:signal transduction histidine kinase